MVNPARYILNSKLRPLLLEGAFVLLLALALGHGGPYGTFERFDQGTRLAFWVVIIMMPWGLAKLLHAVVRRFSPENLSANYISVMLTPLIVLIGSAVVSSINLKVGLHQNQTFLEVWPSSIFVWLVFAFGILLPMILIAHELAKELRKSGVTSMMEFFHHKLPESIKDSQLIALKAEDHYLRVITDTGNALILMKFTDALAVLNGYPGVQTHRSWWVASAQLKERSELNSKDSNIVLSDGTRVPVSRRKRKLVNECIRGAQTRQIKSEAP